jgi:multiple RNA-binding domain-containing protein 1
VVLSALGWGGWQGVSKEAFAGKRSATPRSDTVILVKNLPFDTTVTELGKCVVIARPAAPACRMSVRADASRRRAFDHFGALGRVVLPPSRAIGLVEFLHATDAKKAFRGCVCEELRSRAAAAR